jgi:hypothetical protein
MNDLLIKIFCDIDDYCNLQEKLISMSLLESNDTNSNVIQSQNCIMSLSEVTTIIVYFHFSGYRKFKDYYKNYICKFLKSYFPKLVSYNRFIELMPYTLPTLLTYVNLYCFGSVTGITFIDSTPLPVCHNRRIHLHKVFTKFAERGKTSTGWFYGFKLHLVCNDMGEIISFYLTPGNVDDRNETVIDNLTKNLFGKLIGDKGYISKELVNKLHERGIELITKLRKNSKNTLPTKYENRLLLRKRAIIESLNDFLKNTCNIDHTRHRSPANFLVNLVSGICAYKYIEKKPSLKFERNLRLVC